MKCVKFRLIQIRNMEDTTILPDEGLTIFTGENGSGKTNLIEAVYYASIGKSFRTGNDNEMIRLGDEEGTILLDFTIRDVSHTIKVKLTRNQGKKIFFNDNPVRKKDLMGLFRTVIFTPDELQLIKGAPVSGGASLIWKSPRSPRATMPNSSATPEPSSKETQPSGTPG